MMVKTGPAWFVAIKRRANTMVRRVVMAVKVSSDEALGRITFTLVGSREFVWSTKTSEINAASAGWRNVSELEWRRKVRRFTKRSLVKLCLPVRVLIDCYFGELAVQWWITRYMIKPYISWVWICQVHCGNVIWFHRNHEKSVVKKVCNDKHRLTTVKLKIIACLQFVLKMQITRYFVNW